MKNGGNVFATTSNSSSSSSSSNTSTNVATNHTNKCMSNGSRSRTSHSNSSSSNNNHRGDNNSGSSSIMMNKNGRRTTLQTSRTVLYGRIVFVTVLVMTAIGLGYGTYVLLSTNESETATIRFDSITTRAVATASMVLESKKKATDSLALMVATAHPNASEWPNVYMEGYEQIATSLRIVTRGSLSFCPIVQSGGVEQTSFEDFYYNVFYNVQGYPNDTGVSDFGRGIFSYGTGPHSNQTWPDGRFQSVDGWTYHRQDPTDILVPFVQSDYGLHEALMMNVFFEHNRAAAIMNVIQCTADRLSSSSINHYDMECGTLTDLMWSETQAEGVEAGPAGLIFSPIYPRNDNTTLTGFIVGKQIWYDLLLHGFEADVSGLHVVLRTAQNAHTYRIEQGEVLYVGPGQLHDPHARYQATNYSLYSKGSPNGLFNNYTVDYIVDIYSTNEYYMQYSTNTPLIACIGVVVIIFGTSLLFFGYDFFVRKEFHNKRRSLEAKRRFVRFVSHEVRTPLNTVCMGLTLLQHDLQAAASGQMNERRHHIHHQDDESDGNGKEQLTQSLSKLSTLNTTDVDEVMVARMEEWRDLASQVYENANLAVTVLSDLLNYDKIQMGTLTLDLSLIPIWHILDRTVAEFKVASIEKKVNLILDFGPLFTENNIDGMDDDDDGVENDMESSRNNTKPGIGGTVSTVSEIPSTIRTCKIVGDDVRFTQVLRNLISNGLKFSKENGNLTIRVSVAGSGKQRPGKTKETITLRKDEEVVVVIKRGAVVIEVIDDGVGMTPDQVKVVFEDGTQFNANENQGGGGSGLGLSIAKGIVDQHGGTLSCHSDGLGLGTSFLLTLPLYDYDDDNTVEGGTANPTKLHTERGGDDANNRLSSFVHGDEGDLKGDVEYVIPKLNVLVVDDAVTNRKLCMRLLERNGHVCTGACDGVEAVEKVRQASESRTPYDCILLDYEMPNMKGPEACGELRKMGCSSYIVGVTGNVMSEDVDHFRNSGADWVLAKPFRMEALEQLWVENDVTPFNTLNGAEEETTVVRVSSSSRLVGMDSDLARSLQEQENNIGVLLS